MKTVEWGGSRPGGEILDFSDEKSVSYPYTGSARGAAQTQRMTPAHRAAQGLNAVQALMATASQLGAMGLSHRKSAGHLLMHWGQSKGLLKWPHHMNKQACVRSQNAISCASSAAKSVGCHSRGRSPGVPSNLCAISRSSSHGADNVSSAEK